MSLTPALFTSAAADGPDATKLRPSNWNRVTGLLDSLLDSATAHGALLYRDTADVTDGASWLPDVALGSVLVSGGVGEAPVWSATPSLDSLTLTTPLDAASGGTGTSTTFTAGSIVFAGLSGVYAQDNANLLWDDANNQLKLNGTPIYGYGTDNLFFGMSTGNRTLTGDINFAAGHRTLTALTSGRQNVAIGSDIMPLATSANYNIALGGFALNEATTAQLNVAIGVQALQKCATGGSNTAVGNGSLNLCTGSNNTGIGRHVLLVHTSGVNNTALGFESLRNNTTGDSNTGLGTATGQANTTGSNNTFIGYGANAGSSALIYACAIGAGAIVSANNSLVLGGTGTFAVNVGVGTTTPTSKLQVVGLPSYADNAAALAGGLTAGAFYHTSGALRVVT